MRIVILLLLSTSLFGQSQRVTYCKNDPKLIAYQDSLTKYNAYKAECTCHRLAMTTVYPPKNVVIYKEPPTIINHIIKQPVIEEVAKVPDPEKKEIKVVYKEQEKKITTIWRTKNPIGVIRIDSSLTVYKKYLPSH